MERIASLGSTMDQREPTEESLLVSAISSARNDAEVAALIVELIADREDIFGGLIAEGQRSGLLTLDVTSASVSRLALMIALGSVIVGALDIEPIDHEEWATLMARLVGSFRA